MEKELQNLAWASLPKQTRDKIKDIVETSGMIIQSMFHLVFGDNLTFDKEPDEVLCVDRNKVQEWYHVLSKDKDIHKEGTDGRIRICARLDMMEELFGKNKCLYDD